MGLHAELYTIAMEGEIDSIRGHVEGWSAQDLLDSADAYDDLAEHMRELARERV